MKLTNGPKVQVHHLKCFCFISAVINNLSINKSYIEKTDHRKIILSRFSTQFFYNITLNCVSWTLKS